jgi:hypothetical protein
LALATVRFVDFPRAALATLRALPRLAEFPLLRFARLCTFDAFLRLAMIAPVPVGVPQRIMPLTRIFAAPILRGKSVQAVEQEDGS